MESNARRCLIDIGANLTDRMFQGIYHGKQQHPPDLTNVLKRAASSLYSAIITGTSVDESKAAIKLARQYGLYCTAGIHPTHSHNWIQGQRRQELNQIKQMVEESLDVVVAWGELGLDYERLHFADKESQLACFSDQLSAYLPFKDLPLFLHNRKSTLDLLDNLSKIAGNNIRGVIHSFDGSLEDLASILQFSGLFIGLNGCSLRTEENLNVIREIPMERLMVETDAPWCEIKPSHASFKFVSRDASVQKTKPEKWNESMVKGRSEPHYIHEVVQVIAALKEKPIEEIERITHENTLRLFGANIKQFTIN